MENNNITSANSTSMMQDKEQSELALMFLDILDFTGLMESETAQTVMGFLRRLTGTEQQPEYAMVTI